MRQAARLILLLLLIASSTVILASPAPEQEGDGGAFERYLAAVRAQREAYQRERKNLDQRHRKAIEEHQRWSDAQDRLIKQRHARHRAALQQQVTTQRKQWEQFKQERDKWIESRYPATTQWNNPWYYRGF